MTTANEPLISLSFPASERLRYATVHRARVADAIERGLAAGACWLVAPGGYGKTTAVTDYLSRYRLSALWVRIEASDSDPAKFFRHMSECLTEEQRREVPRLEELGLAHVSEFADRFFRAYFAQLHGTVIVFDDLHRVDAQEFAAAIEAMLRALPLDGRCICSSRSMPSSAVNHLIAQGRLHTIDEQILKFTPREARLLIAQRLRIAASMVDISTAQGHASDLVVLARQLAVTAAQSFVGDTALRAGLPLSAYQEDEAPLLQIDVLGSFQIHVAGRTLELGAKTPAKSLDILQALAISPNRSCTLDDLYEWFWPDADGDQAKAACDQALHRLRKLLGDGARVTQRNGRVQLSEHNLCVDLDQWEIALQFALRPTEDKIESERAMERAFKSFAGPLVQCDRSTRWIQSAAERVRGKFIELTARLACAYEVRGAHARARAVYLRALDMYPTCGRCYESLIRGGLAQNDIARAVEDYRRYERMLRAADMQPCVAVHAAIKQAMSARTGVQQLHQFFSLA